MRSASLIRAFSFILHIYGPEIYVHFVLTKTLSHGELARNDPGPSVRACVWSNPSFPVARIIYKREIYKNDKCDQCLAMLSFTNLWVNSADDMLK